MSNQPEYRDSLFIPTDDRSNFKQIIAKRSDLVRFAGGRLAPSMVPGSYNAGLVLGYATSGGDNGFYKAYNSANTDGSQVAAGVLSEDATVTANSVGTIGNGSEVVIIKEGDLLQTMLIGLDATAITAMSGKSYVDHGVQILSIRA